MSVIEQPGFKARYDTVKSSLHEHWFSYLLLAPTVLFLLLLVWVPFLNGVWMSLHQWPFGSGDPTFVGLGNYEYLLTWGPFYTSLKATFVFALTTFLQLGAALLAALLVVNIGKFKNVVSASFLIPYTMPPVATGTVWLYLLDPSLGPVFKFLTQNGILQQPIYWASEGNLALAVVTLVTAWTFWPFMFIIILATLESIPTEYYESARMYGASRWDTFRHITLPHLRSAILVAVSIRLAWNMTKVSQTIQMTGGGPGYDTSLLAVFLYRFAYEQGQMGMAFAVGVILLIIMLVFIALFIREFELEEAHA